MVKDNSFWSCRKKYLKGIETFLDAEIDGDTFFTQISILRKKNMNTAKIQQANIEANVKTDTNFQFNSKCIGFSKPISSLYNVLDLFDSNLEYSDYSIYELGEGGLKKAIKEDALPQILSYCDEIIE